MNKKGVSLIILVVTVIILSVLTSVSITVGLRSVNLSNVNLLESNLSQIQEYLLANTQNNSQVMTYAMQRYYTKAELENMVDPKKREYLKKEFIQNNETEESRFTRLDMESISNNTFSTGKGIEGPNDYYYVSTVTNKVYYLEGAKSEGKTYFSLSKEIEKVDKNNENKVNTYLVRENELVAQAKVEEEKPSNEIGPDFKIVDKGSFNLLYVIPKENSDYEHVYIEGVVVTDENGKIIEDSNMTSDIENLTSRKVERCVKIPKNVSKIKVKIQYRKDNFEIVELDNIVK